MKIGSPIRALRLATRPKYDNVHQWWPARLRWVRNSCVTFFDWHGWQTGWSGARRVFGQTFHIGAIKLILGGERSKEDCYATQAPLAQEAPQAEEACSTPQNAS